MTFRIWVALEFLQYLDNHEPQRLDFCIECTPTDRTCQLYHHQVKIMFLYDGTNNLVSGAFLKCFSIVKMRFEGVKKKINNVCYYVIQKSSMLFFQTLIQSTYIFK